MSYSTTAKYKRVLREAILTPRDILLSIADYSTTRRDGPRREKTCLRGFANNTGADQPAHPRSLISAFVIRCLESIIC